MRNLAQITYIFIKEFIWPVQHFSSVKKASLDGTTLIARNEDGGDKPNPQRFVVINPENQPKHYRSIATACEFDLPENPLSYTSTPDADSSYGIWAAAGINSENVAMTATETSTTNSRILDWTLMLKQD